MVTSSDQVSLIWLPTPFADSIKLKDGPYVTDKTMIQLLPKDGKVTS